VKPRSVRIIEFWPNGPWCQPYTRFIHLGGEAAAIVPLAELRRLRAVERHASPEALEEAEIVAALAAHDEWVGAGARRPERVHNPQLHAPEMY
jgi:hypothetical protein